MPRSSVRTSTKKKLPAKKDQWIVDRKTIDEKISSMPKALIRVDEEEIIEG